MQVHQDNAADVPSQNELKQALEKGTDESKIETMVSRLPLEQCEILGQATVTHTSTEEDSLHNVERRPPSRAPHAHNTIRHAQQVETSEETHVPVLGGLPETRFTRKAPAGMDIGVQCDSIRPSSAKRVCEGKYFAVPV
jgi:hypothetical protein